MAATFLNWNFERRAPHSRQAGIMLQRAAAQQPDVICLTEAHRGSTATLGGHEVADRGPSWSNKRGDDERLALLWSPNPWRDLDLVGNGGTATGGFLSGITDTPAGALHVIGICAPHHAASPVGATQRARFWTEQIAFWTGLAKLIAAGDRNVPTVLLGDFNQYVPRIWGSKAAHAALLAALADMAVATRGPTIGRASCRERV